MLVAENPEERSHAPGRRHTRILRGVGTEIFRSTPPDRPDLDDVTDQVVDAQGRLSSLRASRDRLRALLDRAGGVSDVITVERELARVQAEIESLEGRLAVLQGAVALSEVNIRLEQKHELGPVAKVAVGLGRALKKLFVLH